MRVAIIGGTGLVGSHLLPMLSGHDVLLLTRRASGIDGISEKVAPMEEWPRLLQGERIDAAISTLDTTWKKAGSWPAFEAVDRTAVVAFARAAHAAGARHMISVSSVGADPGSSNQYLALKGKVEEELRQIGFDRLDILRPGLLRGDRGADRRLGERLGIVISPVTNLFMRGPLDRFAAIDAATVSAAIARLLDQVEPGLFIHHNREIRSAVFSPRVAPARR